MTTRREDALIFLKENKGGSFTTKELSEILGISPQNAFCLLNKLTREHIIQKKVGFERNIKGWVARFWYE